MVGGSRRRRERVLQARAVALFTIALTLSAVSSAIAARTEPSVDETVLTRQGPGDSGPKPSKPPKPTKPPKPSHSPSSTPESSPSPEPSPEPSPDPTSSSPPPTSSPAPDPAPTSPGTTPAPPGDGPTASGAPTEGDTPLGSGEVPPSSYEAALDLLDGRADRGARDGTASLFGTVGSIIDALTSSDEGAIRAAEAPSTCLGSDCGSSTTDATENRAPFIVLICLAIAVAGVFVIRAMSPRSTRKGNYPHRP